jgi:methyl-accepting chemotaxis protein
VNEEQFAVKRSFQHIVELDERIRHVAEQCSLTARQAAAHSADMGDIQLGLHSMEDNMKVLWDISEQFTASAQIMAANGEKHHMATELIAEQADLLKKISGNLRTITDRFVLE